MEDACVTGGNYIIRNMFRWFRQAPAARETAVAMVDPRPGDELLVIGATDARLAAACAAVTGLNGRAVIVGRGAADKQSVEDAARAAGALVEFVDAPPTMLPLDSDTFTVVVIARLGAGQDANAATVSEAMRVARPAGRIIAIAGQKRTGVLGAFSSPPERVAVETVIALLKAAGGVAARRLAEAEGVAYYEARKPRPSL
jgi:ubiquinone/menaquinone biosynthesis C-methylase UbiE